MELPPLSLPTFPDINLSFFISTPVLKIILGLFFLAYFMVSVVLFYHWISYGMRSLGILATETLFTSVSVILFIVAGLALYYL